MSVEGDGLHSNMGSRQAGVGAMIWGMGSGVRGIMTIICTALKQYLRNLLFTCLCLVPHVAQIALVGGNDEPPVPPTADVISHT